jgi:O-antigen/teichoic acid export membrane protein
MEEIIGVKRKIARNSFFLSASHLFARGIGFFYAIFLARFLGVHDFGIYSFTLAFIYPFIQVADFGIERYILRDLSRDPGKSSQYLASLLPLRILFSIAALVIAVSLGFILGQPPIQILYFIVFGLALIPFNLVFLFTSYLNSQEKMEYYALANIAQIALTAGLGILFALLKLGLGAIFLSYPLANLILLLFFLANAKKWKIPLGWNINWDFWKKSLSESWVFAALLIIAVFYLRLSTIMVGVLKGPEATGLYSSASKFVEAMILIPQSLALALFPLTSKLILEDKERLKRVYKKGLAVLFLCSLPFSFVLIFGSRIITGFAFGQEYLPAIPVFMVLGISVIFFFLNALAGTIIQNSRQVKKFLPFAGLNFVALLIFTLILIPKYSIIGAAWAVVGGEIAGLIINNIFVYQILKGEGKVFVASSQ